MLVATLCLVILKESEVRGMDWLGAIIRFIVSALVLMFVGFLLPGFSSLTFFNALLAAIVIAALGWVVESTLGKGISPYRRGLVGFIVSALVIWAAQLIVPGMEVTFFGALLAAFIIGIIDLFVPTAVR